MPLASSLKVFILFLLSFLRSGLRKLDHFQAHACLSDKIRRRDFNSDRRDSYCKECHQKSDTNGSEERNGHYDRRRTKSKRILQALKEVQNRFKEECRVIESCLRANAAFQRDFPLFDPSDYLLFPEYPHHRDRVTKNPPDISSNHASEVQNSKRRGGGCESPLYQARPENKPNRTKNPSFRYWVVTAFFFFSSTAIVTVFFFFFFSYCYSM